MSRVAILIISHKPNLNPGELRSLQRCLEILSEYPTFLIIPRDMDFSFYQSEFDALRIFSIDPAWQASYQSFNRLKTSPFLYECFHDYDFLLFYELDAWVFRDELQYWCDQDYDYIGAPWISLEVSEWLRYPGRYPWEIKKFHQWSGSRFIGKIGNGGFSLRKTKSMLFNTKLFGYRGKTWNANEDSFFAHYVAPLNPFFKVPAIETALRFSFDVNPANCYQLNGSRLPFGCHGYSRSDSPFYVENRKFWSQFVDMGGL